MSELLVVQLIPSGEVAISPPLAAATSKPNSDDQHTEFHAPDEVFRSVQVIPLGLVMALEF